MDTLNFSKENLNLIIPQDALRLAETMTKITDLKFLRTKRFNKVPEYMAIHELPKEW